MYVTIGDLHDHRRSQVMVQNESLYMSSYLWRICNFRPIWHRYWDIDMQHFCNYGYIFERLFRPFPWRNMWFLIWFVRDDIKDQFSFYLKSLAWKKKEL